MTTKVYWNNICLVTKFEEEFINNNIKKSPKPIEFSYFGLGRYESMLNHFKKNKTIDADIIVSTDTDVFHDNRYSHIFNDFEPLEKFITIPLVLIYNQKALDDLAPPSFFSDLFSDQYKGKIAFGGPHNSAGKSLIKSLWYTYGYEKALSFIKESVATSMPAAAFHKAMTGEIPIAVVPTIFALRAGVSKLKMVWPKDGAIPIHSYVAKRKGLSNEMNNFFSNTILNAVFQALLVKNAAILPSHPKISYPRFKGVENYPLMEPNWNFLQNLDHQKLYAMLS